MRGTQIPMTTKYIITKTGTRTFKEPLYKLTTTEEIKARQDKLGKNMSWYFGTWCKKCCGVYPAIMSEGGFRDNCYYVCLVCGKESLHEPMPWIARDDWNTDQYEWQPQEPEFKQMTIFEWLESES